MDAASFERVYTMVSLRHPSAASSGGSTAPEIFGPCWCRVSGATFSRESLQSVGISARAMQRFLTEAGGPDTVIGRLRTWPPRLWVFDGSGLPQAGQVLGGSGAAVLRQVVGKVANCQAGMFLAYVSPLGRALVDKGLYLPKSFGSGPLCGGWVCRRRDPVHGVGRGMELLERAMVGPRRVGCRETTPSGWSPFFRDGLAALGMATCWTFPAGTPAGPWIEWTSPEYQGFGRPRKPKLGNGQRQTMEQRSDELPDEASAGDNGGPGVTRAAHLPVQRPAGAGYKQGKPGEEIWAVYRQWTAERYYLSNAPEDTTTLAYVGGSRWRIETEFETEKGPHVGLENTRPGVGPAGITT